MKAMVDDHKEDLKKFKTEADKGKDPDVKQFASKHVSVLEQHLSMAEKADQEIRGAGKAGDKSSAKKAEGR
jgi:putative membrane protein